MYSIKNNNGLFYITDDIDDVEFNRKTNLKMKWKVSNLYIAVYKD